MILNIIIIIAIIQYYICWATYLNWFRNEFKYLKLTECYSFYGTIFILPLFIWIPILPIYVISIATNKKYLTFKIWK